MNKEGMKFLMKENHEQINQCTLFLHGDHYHKKKTWLKHQAGKVFFFLMEFGLRGKQNKNVTNDEL